MVILIGAIWFTISSWYHARNLRSPDRRRAYVAFYLDRPLEYRQIMSVFLRMGCAGWILNAGLCAMAAAFWMISIAQNVVFLGSSYFMVAASILFASGVILYLMSLVVGYTGKPERWILPEYKALLKVLKEDRSR